MRRTGPSTRAPSARCSSGSATARPTRVAAIAQTEIGIVSYTLSADYLARVGADFDTHAVDDEILAELNRMVPPGVVVHRNGKAFADDEVAADAREIDWEGLLGQIDVDAILSRHGQPGR